MRFFLSSTNVIIGREVQELLEQHGTPAVYSRSEADKKRTETVYSGRLFLVKFSAHLSRRRQHPSGPLVFPYSIPLSRTTCLRWINTGLSPCSEAFSHDHAFFLVSIPSVEESVKESNHSSRVRSFSIERAAVSSGNHALGGLQRRAHIWRIWGTWKYSATLCFLNRIFGP